MAWIGPVVQGVTGLAQTIAASAAAKKLPDAQKYEATPQMRRAEAMALRRAEQGYVSAERALHLSRGWLVGQVLLNVP
jgi:hypothetical protein